MLAQYEWGLQSGWYWKAPLRWSSFCTLEEFTFQCAAEARARASGHVNATETIRAILRDELLPGHGGRSDERERV
jgi:hypothetical protein